ncbi:MAG: TRIC cation channel family protein [Flavobacteriales bacterium AspAUS03]
MVEYLRNPLFFFDLFRIGIFTVLGIKHGLNYGFNPTISILLGTITASFGGMIEMFCAKKTPSYFARRSMHLLVFSVEFYFSH